MPRSSVFLGLLAVWLGVSPASAQPPAAGRITFFLAPLAQWNEGQPKAEHLLTEGTVRLYRVGAFEPSIEGRLAEPIEIPAGDWVWVAEAAGFVTTSTAPMHLPGADGTLSKNGAKGTLVKNLLWPAVPACEMSLGERQGWSGIDRVDFVSLDHSAVFPVHPGKRRRLNVPAGRWLAYAVGPRGLVGITQPRLCGANQILRLPTIGPPPPDREELLVHVELPVQPSVASAALEVIARQGSSAVEVPAAVAWLGSRASYFFLDLPSATDRRLEARHPALRTSGESLAAAAGQAREINLGLLLPRRELHLSLSYRPAREHRRAVLHLVACGDRKPAVYSAPGACAGERREFPLDPARTEYSFLGLDDGFYQLFAEIDEEVVHGLGAALVPHLPPETNTPLVLEPVTLEELHVFGHLLVDGEPVPGEVRLSPLRAGSWPTRRFATEEDLRYHLYYFGHVPQVASEELPATVRERLTPSSRGLYLVLGWGLSACDGEGFCRTFNVHSSLTGSGRLDLDLGSQAQVLVRVLEEGSGRPVEGAIVGFALHRPALHFVAGETEWAKPEGAEGEAVNSDARGEARLRFPSREPVTLAVGKRGFTTVRRQIVPPAERAEEVVMFLSAEGSGAEATTFEVAGRPLDGAFLLGIDEAGNRRPDCAMRTNGAGKAELPASCRDLPRMVVFHPAAAIQFVAPGDAAPGARVGLLPAPTPSLKLRLQGADDRPLSAVPVAFRIDGIELGPNDFLWAKTRTGYLLFYLTDERGELVLQGVAPQLGGEIVVFWGDRRVTESIVGRRPGETITMTIED